MLSFKDAELPPEKKAGMHRILKAATAIFDVGMQLKTVARAYLQGQDWFPLALPLLETLGDAGKDLLAFAKEEGLAEQPEKGAKDG